MTASMPTENFGNFVTGSLFLSSYQNFRNCNTARFPKATKLSEILVPGTKCSRYSNLRNFSTARQARKRLPKGSAPKDEVAGARGAHKKNGGDQHDTVLLGNAKGRGYRGQGCAQKNGGDQHDTVLLENIYIYIYVYIYIHTCNQTNIISFQINIIYIYFTWLAPGRWRKILVKTVFQS